MQGGRVWQPCQLEYDAVESVPMFVEVKSSKRARSGREAFIGVCYWLVIGSALLISGLLIGQFLGGYVVVPALVALDVWGLLIWKGSRKLSGAVTAIVAIVAALWYLGLEPSNDRNWVVDTSRLPHVEIEDSRLRVQNLRDFRWESADRCDPVWRSENYDLDTLESLRLVVEPLGDSELVAHVMLQFGFANEKSLVVSVEARREQGESYGLLAGAARQFELIYVLATDSDILDLRANHRGSRVYSYPLRVGTPFMRRLLVDLCLAANELHEAPKFYATLRNNCTTTLLRHIDQSHETKIGFRYEILFPAKTGQLAFGLGLVDSDLPFEEAREAFRIEGGGLGESRP